MFRAIFMMRLSVTNTFKRPMTTRSQEDKSMGTKQKLMKLRNKTGYPLINCRQALKATEYDMKKAEEHLLNLAREKGWGKMQDVVGKSLSNGLVAVAKNKTSAAIVEVNCPTDFVAQTTVFQRIAKECAQTALKNFSTLPLNVSVPAAELMEMVIPGKEVTLQEEIALAVGKLKEAIVICRASVLTPPPGGFIASYIHPSILVSATRPGFTLGSYAVIASISCSDDNSSLLIRSKGRDLCQHIVGMKPSVIEKTMVSVEEKLEENSIPKESMSNDAAGEQETNYFSLPDDTSDQLLRQPFLLDADISVEAWLAMHGLKVHDFVRYQVGETVKL